MGYCLNSFDNPQEAIKVFVPAPIRQRCWQGVSRCPASLLLADSGRLNKFGFVRFPMRASGVWQLLCGCTRAAILQNLIHHVSFCRSMEPIYGCAPVPTPPPPVACSAAGGCIEMRIYRGTTKEIQRRYKRNYQDKIYRNY